MSFGVVVGCCFGVAGVYGCCRLLLFVVGLVLRDCSLLLLCVVVCCWFVVAVLFVDVCWCVLQLMFAAVIVC